MNFAFNFNLRCYMVAARADLLAAAGFAMLRAAAAEALAEAEPAAVVGPAT